MEQAELDNKLSRGPETGTAYWVKTDDGVRLRIATWMPQEAPRGAILLFLGRTDYIEQYGMCATDLTARGFAVTTLDWRGQGLSDRLTDDRNKGHVHSFSDYQADASAVLQAAETLDLPRPWYLLAHSMGGSIGLRALSEGRLRVSACAFTAPMWEIHLAPALNKVALPLAKMLKSIGLATSYAPGQSDQTYVLREPFEGNTLTSDKDMYEYWLDLAKNLPDRQSAGPTIGWLYEALSENRSIMSAKSPKLPCVCFYGEEEAIVGLSGIKRRMETWSDGQLVAIPNAKHEILMETPEIRTKVLDKICDLFEKSPPSS